MSETVKNARVRVPKEVIDFIKENGNLSHSDMGLIINLPQWFIETDTADVYEIVFGRDLIAGAEEFKNKCVNEQDLLPLK